MPDFSAVEERVLRYLEERLMKDTADIPPALIAMDNSLTEDECRRMMGRFKALNVFEEEWDDGTVIISNRVHELISELDHRPPVNHWKKAQECWFSKRWSLPITAVAVGTPILVQWIQWFIALIRWYTGTPLGK